MISRSSNKNTKEPSKSHSAQIPAHNILHKCRSRNRAAGVYPQSLLAIISPREQIPLAGNQCGVCISRINELGQDMILPEHAPGLHQMWSIAPIHLNPALALTIIPKAIQISIFLEHQGVPSASLAVDTLLIPELLNDQWLCPPLLRLVSPQFPIGIVAPGVHLATAAQEECVELPHRDLDDAVFLLPVQVHGPEGPLLGPVVPLAPHLDLAGTQDHCGAHAACVDSGDWVVLRHLWRHDACGVVAVHSVQEAAAQFVAEGHQAVTLLELGEHQGVVGTCSDVDHQVLLEAQLGHFEVLREVLAVRADLRLTGTLAVDVVAT